MQQSRIQSKIPSQVTCGNSKVNRTTLQLIYNIFSSCHGPRGRTKMIQNSVGGPLTVTSSSSRLLSSLSISNPVLNLISSAVRSHLNIYQDSGLSVLCSVPKLLSHSYDIDLNMISLTRVYEIFLEELLNFLGSTGKSKDCLNKFIRCDIELSELKCLKALIRTLLTSKPLCQLKDVETDHLIQILIESFLISIPEEKVTNYLTDRTLFITLPQSSFSESKLFRGILISSPEISVVTKKDISIVKRMQNGKIKVALVTISMSGDSEELTNVMYENLPHNIDTTDQSVLLIEQFCQSLMDQNVGLLLCQKVIHPRVKRYLREKSILFVERIGLQMIGFIRDLTGAVPLTHFHSLDNSFFGCIDSVKTVWFNMKSFLHLEKEGQPLSTVVICNRSEEKLKELKVLCQSSLASMYSLLENSRVLLGGGCWQFVSYLHMKKRVQDNPEIVSSETGLSKLLIYKAGDAFCNSMFPFLFEDRKHCDYFTCVTSPHIWKIDKLHAAKEDEVFLCGCGLYTKHLDDLQNIDVLDQQFSEEFTLEPKPTDINVSIHSTLKLDNFASNINALRTSVFTTNTILSIGQYIMDEN